MSEAYNIKSLPSFFAKHMKGAYSTVSINDPDNDNSSQPDLDKEEGTFTTGDETPKRKTSHWLQAILLCLVILVTVVVTGAIVTAKSPVCVKSSNSAFTAVASPFTQSLPAMKHLKPKDCGHNSTTARARGCHFDVMSMIWMPHECYDSELTAEFRSLRDWEWSLHENGSDLIAADEIQKGDIPHGWVRFEYHLTHCLYTWKKLNRQVERGGGPIDGYISNSTHTHHCSKMLELRDIPKESWNTPFIVLYPTCYV